MLRIPITFVETCDTIPVALLSGDCSIPVAFEDLQVRKVPMTLETLSATPTSGVQVFTPTAGVDGYSQVTVNAIPQNYGLIARVGAILTVS